MAEILEILDKGQVLSDIDAVIGEIAKLEEAITKASNKLLTVKVELYGAESLQDVLEGTNAIRKAMVDLGIVQKQNSELVADLDNKYGMLGKSVQEGLEDYAQLKIQLTVLNAEIAKQNALLLKGGADAEKAAAALDPLIQQQRKLQVEVTNANNIINKSVDERIAKAQEAAEKERIAEINKTNALKIEGEKRVAAMQKEQQQKEKAYQQEGAREIKRVQQATSAAQKIVDANSAIYNSVSGLRAKMVELQLAGEGLSQEYLILAERANALTVANQKVNNAVSNPAGLAAHIQSTKSAGTGETVNELSAEDAALARINARIEQSVAEETALAEAKYKDLAVTEQLNVANANSHKTIKTTSERIADLQANLASLQAEQSKSKEGTAKWKQWETAIVNTKGQLQKLGVETANVTPKVEKTAEAFKIMGINVESMMVRMTLRMVAFQLIFTPIISGITAVGQAIWDAFTKASDAETAAKDALQGYADTFKASQLDKATLASRVVAGILIDQTKAQIALNTVNDIHNKTLTQRIKAYEDLQKQAPEVFKSLTEQQKITGDFTASQLTLNAAIDAQNNLKEKTVNLESSSKAKAASDEALKDLESTEIKKSGTLAGRTEIAKGFYHKQVTEEVKKNKIATDDLTKAQKDFNDAYEKMNSLKVIDDKKEKKPKKDNAKGLEAELRDEEERYKLELQKYKEMYLAKDNTFEEARIVHQKELYKQESDAAKNHADFMNEIIAKKEYKYVDSKFARAARLKKIEEEKVHALNDLTGKEQEAALEKIRIEEDLMKKQDEAYERMKEHMAEMIQLDRDLAEMKESANSKSDYAHGISPFLEAFGYDGDFVEQQKQFDIQRKAKENEISDIRSQKDVELHRVKDGGMPDTKKLDKFDELIGTKENELAQITLDKEAALEAKLIKGKKELAAKTIELAQKTADSINAIQENQFAHEERQIEIQKEALALRNQQQIEAINATTNYAITKDNLLAAQAARTAARQNELQAESNALALRKARFEKQAAEQKIEMDTAVGVMGIWAEYGKLPILAAALSAVVVGIGAAQYNAVESAPLPQFEKGGKTYTSHFIAAEGNKPELIIAPSGETSLATKEGIYTAPIGSTVKNASETEKMLKYAINGIGFNAMSMGMLQEQRVKQMTDKRIVEELQDLKSSLVNTLYATKSQTPKNDLKNTVDRLYNAKMFRK